MGQRVISHWFIFYQGFDYSRSGNPTRNNFEDAVALLEGGKHGLAFSSGSATTATIINSLQAGSHVISVNDVYGGTYRYFTKVAVGNGVDTTFVDLANAADIEPHFKPNTKVCVFKIIRDCAIKGMDHSILRGCFCLTYCSWYGSKPRPIPLSVSSTLKLLLSTLMLMELTLL